MTYIAFDTNIFLHFRSPDEFDFEAIGIKDEIMFLTPLQVIYELDKKKYDYNLSSRAKKALRFIIGKRERKSCKIVEYLNGTRIPPSSEILAKGGNPEIDDHKLLTEISNYIIENKISSFYLISNDLTVQLYASTFKVEVKEPGEVNELPFEKSAEAIELEKSRKELQKIKDAKPKLNLMFSDKSKIFNAHANVDLSSIKDIIADKKEELQSYYYLYHPYHSEPIAEDLTFHNIRLRSVKSEDNFMWKIHSDQNRRVLKFVNNYIEFLQKMKGYMIADRLIFCLEIVLINSGKVAAEKTEIELIFPDNIKLIRSSDELKLPSIPEAVQISSGNLNGISQKTFKPEINYKFKYFKTAKNNIIDPGITNFRISKDKNSYSEIFNIVLQESVIPIESLYFFAFDRKEIEEFNINYIIRSKNDYGVTEGTLNYKIVKNGFIEPEC